MNNKVSILYELKEVAPELCALNTSMPFSVPSGYFEQFSSQVTSQLQKEITQQKQPYSIPNNYFDSVTDAVLNKIKSSSLVERSSIEKELELIAPFLNTLERRNVYTVPELYFENLSSSYTEKEIPIQAKIVPIKTKWFNIAVAASVITILFVSSSLFVGTDNKFDYDAYNKIDVKKGIDKINDAELEKFLVNENPIINSDVVNSAEIELPDAEERLQSTSDDELHQYLKQVDGATTKSGI